MLRWVRPPNLLVFARHRQGMCSALGHAGQFHLHDTCLAAISCTAGQAAGSDSASVHFDFGMWNFESHELPDYCIHAPGV